MMVPTSCHATILTSFGLSGNMNGDSI
jgi:hypothetical protein